MELQLLHNAVDVELLTKVNNTKDVLLLTLLLTAYVYLFSSKYAYTIAVH